MANRKALAVVAGVVRQLPDGDQLLAGIGIQHEAAAPGAFAIGTDANTTAINMGAVGVLLTVLGNLQVNGTEVVVGATTFQGNVGIGDAITDTVTFTARIATATDLFPIDDNTVDLGGAGFRYKDVYGSNGVFDAMTAGAGVWDLDAATTFSVPAGAAFQIGGVALDANWTAAIVNEMTAFFSTTNITGAEAETLTAGPASDASGLHTHPGIGSAVVDVAATAGEALAVGQPVVFQNAAGVPRVMRGDANGGGVLQDCVGICATAAGGAGIATTVRTAGEIAVPDAQWDIAGGVPAVADVGSRCYLSETIGTLSKTAPSTAGSIVIRVGWISQGGAGAVKVVLGVGEGVTL